MKIIVFEMPKGEGQPAQIAELTDESPAFQPSYKRDLYKVEIVAEDTLQIYVSVKK